MERAKRQVENSTTWLARLPLGRARHRKPGNSYPAIPAEPETAGIRPPRAGRVIFVRVGFILQRNISYFEHGPIQRMHYAQSLIFRIAKSGTKRQNA